jgi:hypothetical protein
VQPVLHFGDFAAVLKPRRQRHGLWTHHPLRWLLRLCILSGMAERKVWQLDSTTVHMTASDREAVHKGVTNEVGRWVIGAATSLTAN